MAQGTCPLVEERHDHHDYLGGDGPAEQGARLVDRAASRLMRLPAATCDYTVSRGVRAAMRDGVELVADHYAPAAPSLGTILVRCPYGRSLPFALQCAHVYAERGYHVLLQSCRGTFGSGDEFQPMTREVEDGQDTVAWLREQPWFGGRLATLGPSYLGFTQWALLMDPPPELATAIILVGPHDFSEAAFGSGAFGLHDFLGWSEMIVHQEEVGAVRGLVRMATADKRLRPALDGLPLAEAGDALLAGRAPWYRGWLSHPDRTDPFWQPTQLGAALDRVGVPVMLVGGWQDLFLGQTLAQYSHLRGRGLDVTLTVGPWTHLDVPRSGAGIIGRESLEWLGEHLAGTGRRSRATPVRVHVTGAQQWRDLPDWPPPATDDVLYLLPGGSLADEPPAPDAAPSVFTYDPADPTPTVGGRMLSPAAGVRDNGALEARADVLTFTGPILGTAIEVLGTPVVELVHGSDNPYADVFARLCEVDAKGVSRNVSDVLLRLDPSAPAGSVLRLELAPVAHRFSVGSRIRLQVSGGSHPLFARNLGTGEPPASATRTAVSRRTIAHGAGGQSRMILPAVATMSR